MQRPEPQPACGKGAGCRAETAQGVEREPHTLEETSRAPAPPAREDVHRRQTSPAAQAPLIVHKETAAQPVLRRPQPQMVEEVGPVPAIQAQEMAIQRQEQQVDQAPEIV